MWMHTCPVWSANTLLQCSELARKTGLNVNCNCGSMLLSFTKQLPDHIQQSNKKQIKQVKINQSNKFKSNHVSSCSSGIGSWNRNKLCCDSCNSMLSWIVVKVGLGPVVTGWTQCGVTVPRVFDRLVATDGHWSHMPLLGIDIGLHDLKK